MTNANSTRLLVWALSILASLTVSACCGSKSKDALEACKKTDEKSAEGLKTCYEAWKQYPESSEWSDLTTQFDTRLDAACKDSARVKDCDTYCPLRITDPGPKNKTLTLSMCVMKGYGTLDGVVTNKKPARVSEMSPEVIEACVAECRSLAANPSSSEYQSCFRGCKMKKVIELNER